MKVGRYMKGCSRIVLAFVLMAGGAVAGIIPGFIVALAVGFSEAQSGPQPGGICITIGMIVGGVCGLGIAHLVTQDKPK